MKTTCSFGGRIHVDSTNIDPTILRHEYGHIVQEKILGEQEYLVFIALPSAYYCDKGLSDPEYYSKMWEYTADLFGNSKRNIEYKKGAGVNAILYFEVVLFLRFVRETTQFLSGLFF